MRRGVALLVVLVAMVLLGTLLMALPWRLGSESRAAIEQLALLRAEGAARSAIVEATRFLEATIPDSLEAALATVPPPVRLPAGALGFSELSRLDSASVEVVAQGFAGTPDHQLARMQLCAFLEVRILSDSLGARVRVQADPGSVAPCPG